MTSQSRGNASSSLRERVPNREKPSPPSFPPWIRNYSLALITVGIALGAALLLATFQFRGVEFPLFLIAIAVTVWYGGVGPAVVALLLSSVAFNYFFTEPLHTLYITRADFPYYVIFILFASLLTWFSAIRRRVERALVQSRSELEKEVVIRTRQASLLDLTHDTIFVRNMDDLITYWNRGAQELFGWSAEEAIGRSAHELLQTTFPSSIAEIRAQLLNTGRWEGELKDVKADGTSVIVASRWSLQRNEAGVPIAILETNNDITQRKHGEEQIRTLNRELAQRSTELEIINKELEAFAYSTSHDLRAPLRHVAGYAELLRKNANSILDDKGRHHLLMIMESAKRMGALIDDLLAFSRIGRIETRETAVNLEQLVCEVKSEVEQDTVDRNIVWKISPLPHLNGDRSMLKLALVNLISNAVKFTRTRPQAEIEIGCAEEHKDGVVLFIRDNGVGFDMRYLNKLFGVFQRLHGTEEFEGTGIGLATVQRIIHRHGGRVWADGVVDGGATFYFSLPKS